MTIAVVAQNGEGCDFIDVSSGATAAEAGDIDSVWIKSVGQIAGAQHHCSHSHIDKKHGPVLGEKVFRTVLYPGY